MTLTSIALEDFPILAVMFSSHTQTMEKRLNKYITLPKAQVLKI